MVVIRLSRGGSNKRPFYKIVATDSRSPRDGRYIEQLGYFNPVAIGGAKRVELNRERITYWMSQGAQPSDRVKSLLKELDKPEILEKRQVKKDTRKAKKKAEAKTKLEAESKAQEATESNPEEKKESA